MADINPMTLFALLGVSVLAGWAATVWLLLGRQRQLEAALVESEQKLQQECATTRELEIESHRVRAERAEQTARLQHLQEGLETLRLEQRDLVQRLSESDKQARQWQVQAERAQTLAREQLRQLEELRTERESTSQRLLALQAEHEQLNVEHSTLRNSLEQRQQHFSEQQQLLRESREQLKLEFEQLAGRIFEAKGQAFSQHSQQSLDALLKPFREQIDQFRTKVEDIHYKETQQQAALTQELLHLKELNRQITQEAHDLSTALRG